MADLLQGYIAIRETVAAPDPVRPIFAIDSYAHISNQGDVWSEPNGWLEAEPGNWIEGISLIPGPEITSVDLLYRVTYIDGEISEYHEPWSLSGDRGRGRAICGFQVRLGSAAAARFHLLYQVRFLDGSEASPVPAGEMCTSPNRMPIVAIRLIVLRR